jgi:transposase
MIVIGLDVHRQSVTAVAVDGAGRPLGETTVSVGSEELIGWASRLGSDRLWAVEDCRQLTRWLERQLLAVGEQLVRVPPKLTVPERRAGRARGKSDPIDALAIARAALREPDLSRPRLDEQVFGDLKLLVDHRDDLVDARRRTQQRLRWHLHALDPTFVVPLRMLGRTSHLERVSRWLARQEQELQVRLARELVSHCRWPNRAIAELDQELEQRAAELAPAPLELPGCAAVTAAKLLAEIGPIDRFKSDAQLARHSGVALRPRRLQHTESEPGLDIGATLAHASALYDPLVPRAGLLHAVGSSRRCGVEIDLESGELAIPERPHVCLMIDKRAAGVPNRRLGVHKGYHLVVLGDELSWLERRVVASRCKTTKPA